MSKRILALLQEGIDNDDGQNRGDHGSHRNRAHVGFLALCHRADSAGVGACGSHTFGKACLTDNALSGCTSSPTWSISGT